MSTQLSPVSTNPKSSAPKGWRWALLGDVARLESGHTPSRRVPEYWEGGDIPWLSLKDLRGFTGKYIRDTEDHPTKDGIENSSARLLPAGTVAFCRTASVGKTVILGREMATSQDFVNWVCGPEIDPEYLYFSFRLSEAFFNKEKQGSTHKTIYFPTVKKFQVLLPPLTEQKRVVRILDAADELRAKRRKALEELDALVRSAFIDLFGDPIANPKGWKLGVIGDLLQSVTYGTSRKAHPSTGAYPILRMNNITSTGGWDFTELKYIDLTKDEVSKHLVHKGQLLFNRTNSKELVGKTAVYRGEDPMAYAGYLVRGIVNSDANPEYIGAFMNTPQMKQFLQRKCKNIVGMANINAKEFAAIPIPKPPVALQNRFAAIVEAVEAQKQSQHAHLAELDALFASLQSRAFKGEL